MPSLEMLKKLLDEFDEKEAHTREEINVVNQQIGELEKRIAAAITRQSKITRDRDKIWEMKNRYTGGRFYSRSVYGLSAASPVQLPASAPSPTPPPPPPANSMLSDAAAQLFSSPPPANPQHSNPVPAGLEPLASAPSMPGQASMSAQVPTSTPTPMSAQAPMSTPAPMPAQAPMPAPMPAQAPMPAPMPAQAPMPAPMPMSPQSSSMASAPMALPPMPIETAISQSSSGSFQALPLAPTPLTQPPADKFDILDLFAPLGNTLPSGDQSPTQSLSQPAAGDFYSANPPSAPTPTQSAEIGHAVDEKNLGDLEDENDDTVKSINDALRGLFR